MVGWQVLLRRQFRPGGDGDRVLHPSRLARPQDVPCLDPKRPHRLSAAERDPGLHRGGATPGGVYAYLSPDVQFSDGPILRTSGDYEPRPYEHLAGSADGTPSQINQTSAEKLFPTLDGDTATLPVADRPDAFYTKPADLTTDAAKLAFIKDFSTWHSAYQLEYIKKYGTLDIQVGDPKTRLTAVVSLSDPTKVIIVQSLDKKSIAKLTLVEQNQILGLPAFAELSASQGLVGTGAAAFSSVKDASQTLTADGFIDELIAEIRTTIASEKPTQPGEAGFYDSVVYGDQKPDDPVGPDGGPYVVDGGVVKYEAFDTGQQHGWALRLYPTMPSADQQPFLDELALLKQQLDGMGVVSPEDIQKAVTDLRTRFQRAFAFYNVHPETTSTEQMGNPDKAITVYHDVISLDGNAAIDRGYQIFIAQEKRMADLAGARMQLAQNEGASFGKRLDVPGLIARFQILYEQSLKAQVTADTEEINQQNDLLKTYAKIQDVVNQTVQQFKSADSDPKRVLGLDVDDYDRLSDDEKKIISMFEDKLGKGQRNPLEALRSLDRPLFDFFKQEKPGSDSRYDLNSYSQTQWSTYGTRLSQAVTIINQNSQLKMNDVTSLQKEADRHFELASNALSKMQDIISNIARI